MKVDKYDRQIRIWGKKGQKRLSQAKVGLIGCSGQGIQALKNLILPGVGQVDIWDNQKVTVEELSSSFFYEHDSIGKLRGEQASKNLLQMNPDVQGKYYNCSVDQAISKGKQCFGQYNLIICGNLLESQSNQISHICWQLDIPVIFISAVGFFFSIRTQKRIHVVENQNTSAKKYYLRLHDPFPALKAYADEKGLTSILQKLQENQMNRQSEQFKKLQSSFSKITYPVFLMQSFKQSTTKKAQDIKSILEKWKKWVGEDQRDGINQAISRTFDLFQTPDNYLPDIGILDDQLVQKSGKQSDFIYLFLKATKKFLQKYKHLPQPVQMPDIHTSTKDYLELKSVYKVEHENNKVQLKQLILEINPDAKIDQELLSEYINNINALQIIKIRPYYEELKAPDTMTSSINYLSDEKNVYLALRTCKRFQNVHKRYPSPSDEEQMVKMSQELAKEWGLDNIDDRYIKDISRYQGKNIVNISSIAGAVTGQQGVKLVTKCFAPMNSSYLYDGSHCKGYSIAL